MRKGRCFTKRCFQKVYDEGYSPSSPFEWDDQGLPVYEELGFENPMPVQEEVIPYLLGNKNDVIALAQTGTGI